MSTDGFDIGDRMKTYENVSSWTMPRRIPVILRVDGRSFHSVAKKKFGITWSKDFVSLMIETASALVAEIQGCSFCYCQSDEISFLITDYKTITFQPWFGYDARKMISISAAVAASTFSQLYGEPVAFDSRVFSIPQDDVCNYFIWRQMDAARNAVQMAGRDYFSHSQLQNVSCSGIKELLIKEKGINFDNYDTVRKWGFCIVDGNVDLEPPDFREDRNYINQWVNIRED